jgi:hypothetical protein
MMPFTSDNIIWIKHVTNNTNGPHAYMNEIGEFTLHVPTQKRGAARTPNQGELILVYQKINGVPCFTHLVSPVEAKVGNGDSVIVDDGIAEFRFGRKVEIIAMTEVRSAIPRHETSWQDVNFRGVGHGNFCNINHIKDIQNIPALRQEIWDRFRPFFTN